MIARYWKSLAAWASALAGLAIVTSLPSQIWHQFHPTETPVAHGAQLALMLVLSWVGWFPYLVALFLPIAAFAAGLHLLPEERPADGLRGQALLRVLASVTLTALAGFVLFSYVSPICKVWFPGLALGRWQLPRWEWIPTRATLLAMYESRGYWADAQVQSMMADGARYNAGLWYHSMESRSIVAGVLALIGALVSLSTRILPAPKARVQHWAIGLFFLVILQPVQDAVTRALLSGRLAPALVAFSVLVVPAAVLLALGWAAYSTTSRPR